jgi:hypothetical protein
MAFRPVSAIPNPLIPERLIVDTILIAVTD